MGEFGEPAASSTPTAKLVWLELVLVFLHIPIQCKSKWILQDSYMTRDREVELSQVDLLVDSRIYQS